MPLPKAIQRQAEQADQLVAQFAHADPSQLVVDPDTGLPLTPPQAPAPAQLDAPPPVAPTPPQEDFEQKYRSIKGKYDAEIPVLRSQAQTFERINNTLSAQVAALTEQVASLQRTPVVSPPVPAAPVRAVTDKDVETFGSDLIDLITRIAGVQAGAVTAEIAPHIEHLRSTMARTNSEVGSVKQNVQQTERALYEQRLTEAVPNWRAINTTPEFLSWLAEFDPVLGKTRQAAVSEAYDAYDAPRTVAFLSAYAAHQRSLAPTRPLTPQEELARQVSPRATQATSVAPVESAATSKRIWSQREISDFYTAAIQGKYKAAPAEKARIEQEIDLAVSEGRVR